VSRIPAKANKNSRRRTTPIRPDVYAELLRLDTRGLDACAGDCAQHRPLPLCEHHQVEERLGYPVDPKRPPDLAIGHALRLIAEQYDYEGADRVTEIVTACEEGRISPATRNRLLAVEHANNESSVRSAAFEVMVARSGYSRIDTIADRRWRSDLDEHERDQRRQLENARLNGTLTGKDRDLYLNLTEPQPLEPIDWSTLPPGLYDEAARLVETEKRRARGELPRTRRVSSSDRRRVSTFETPFFRTQLGAIATADAPTAIEREVRNLRRHAKRLGLLPSDHDRRRRPPSSPA
jgi:hypothetical protein